MTRSTTTSALRLPRWDGALNWYRPPYGTRPQYEVSIDADVVRRPRFKMPSDKMTPEYRKWTKKSLSRRASSATKVGSGTA